MENFDEPEDPEISIHAPRERSDQTMLLTRQKACISIHAPRERSDNVSKSKNQNQTISIHAPRERSDYGFKKYAIQKFLFQSTLLVRGAT